MNPETETLPANFNTLVLLTQTPADAVYKKAQRKALTTFLSGELIGLYEDAPGLKNGNCRHTEIVYCNSVLYKRDKKQSKIL